MDDRLSELREARLWALSPRDLLAALAEAHTVAVRAQAELLRFVREVDSRGLASAHSAPSTAALLRSQERVSIRTAHRWVRTAAALDTAPPVLADAVAAGVANIEQAESITGALAELDGHVDNDVLLAAATQLVEFCPTLGPDQLGVAGGRIARLVAPEAAEAAERAALDRAEARADRDRHLTLTGHGATVAVRGRLTTEQAAIVRAAIDPLSTPAAHDDRTAGQRRADALTDICRLALRTGELPDHGGDRPQLVLTLDFEALKRATGVGTFDNGGTVGPAVARRIACDAGIIPTVLGGNGQPLDVGRERRLFTGRLRGALVLRDNGCAFPDCDRPPRWCDGHHVIPWQSGGRTSLDNGVLLCGFHHREIHQPDSWTVHIATDGLPTFTPPPHIDPLQRPRRNTYHRRN